MFDENEGMPQKPQAAKFFSVSTLFDRFRFVAG